MGAHISLALIIIASAGFAAEGPESGASCGVSSDFDAATESLANDGMRQKARALGMRRARVDLDFHQADIHNVLRLLAAEGRVNIVVGPDVRGSVTMTLKNVLVSDAFYAVLRVNGLTFEKVGEIIMVRRPRP